MTTTTYKPTPHTLDAVRSIAVVGVSNRKNQFGSAAFRELRKRGYDVFPVHLSLDSIDDVKCFRSLADLPLVPDMVLITLKPNAALEVVAQASAKGVRKVWFQQGADFTEAIARAQEAGMEAISGRCVLMYAEPVDGIHRFHRFLSKLVRRY